MHAVGIQPREQGHDVRDIVCTWYSIGFLSQPLRPRPGMSGQTTR